MLGFDARFGTARLECANRALVLNGCPLRLASMLLTSMERSLLVGFVTAGCLVASTLRGSILGFDAFFGAARFDGSNR